MSNVEFIYITTTFCHLNITIFVDNLCDSFVTFLILDMFIRYYFLLIANLVILKRCRTVTVVNPCLEYYFRRSEWILYWEGYVQEEDPSRVR